MHITLHGSIRATECGCVRASFHVHAIHDVCLSVVGPRSVLLLFISVVYLISSTLYLFFAWHSIFNVDTAEGWNPLDSRDAELYDETIGKALSSPLSNQEREELANRRQAYHSHEGSLLPAQSFFAQVRGDPYTNKVQICLRNGNQVATWKN